MLGMQKSSLIFCVVFWGFCYSDFLLGQTGTSVAANSILPSIGITIENAQVGDFFALSNISSTGFDIDIKNGSSFVNRNFKYAATGFGRGS